MKKQDKVILIGYSGHGYVVADAVLSNGRTLVGYCDREEKEYNPFQLKYLGQENSVENRQDLQNYGYAIGVGDNKLRERIYRNLTDNSFNKFKSIIHKSAVLSFTKVDIAEGALVCAGSIINSFAIIGRGTI